MVSPDALSCSSESLADAFVSACCCACQRTHATTLLWRSRTLSVLKTEHIVMEELDQLWVPEVKDWRLNERHYGDCIGETGRELHVLTRVFSRPNPTIPGTE